MKQISEDQWREKLTEEQYHVLREKGTEAPYTGSLLHNDKKGKYTCAACGNVIFDSSTKFDAQCGWPSFYDAKKGSIKLSDDDSLGVVRTEVTCANCGSHLGHVFPDAPEQPTGQRYCINSVAMNFTAQD